MKNLLKIVLFFLATFNASIFAEKTCKKGYIEIGEEISIYRNVSAFPLALSSALAIPFCVVPLFVLYKSFGLKFFKPNNPYAIMLLGVPLFSGGLVAWEANNLSYNYRHRDKPIIKINPEGFYYEKYGFVSWDQIDAPIIVEELEGLRVIHRNIWFARLNEEKDTCPKAHEYIKIYSNDIGVDFETLLIFIKKYKQIYIPPKEALCDYIPISMQSTITPEFRDFLRSNTGSPNRTTVLYCLKDFPHECLGNHA